jgi:hypothetical protein
LTNRTSSAPDQPRFGERPVRRGAGSGFGLTDGLIGGGVLAVILAILVWSAVAGQATPAQHPHLFGGSVVLDDRRPMVVLDLTTGAVTVRHLRLVVEYWIPVDAVDLVQMSVATSNLALAPVMTEEFDVIATNFDYRTEPV